MHTQTMSDGSNQDESSSPYNQYELYQVFRTWWKEEEEEEEEEALHGVLGETHGERYRKP